MIQALTYQQPLGVNHLVEALQAKATIESFIPHLETLPLSADRTVPKT